MVITFTNVIASYFYPTLAEGLKTAGMAWGLDLHFSSKSGAFEHKAMAIPDWKVQEKYAL